WLLGVSRKTPGRRLGRMSNFTASSIIGPARGPQVVLGEQGAVGRTTGIAVEKKVVREWRRKFGERFDATLWGARDGHAGKTTTGSRRMPLLASGLGEKSGRSALRPPRAALGHLLR